MSKETGDLLVDSVTQALGDVLDSNDTITIPKHIKFLAWVFRRTGYTHSSLKAFEYEYLVRNLDTIERQFIEMNSDSDEYYSIEELFSLQRGLIQSVMGLWIESKHTSFFDDSKLNRFIITVRRFFNI